MAKNSVKWMNQAWLIMWVIFFFMGCKGQESKNEAKEMKEYTSQIDSLLQLSGKPFNGNILVTEGGKIQYAKTQGFSDLDEKKPLSLQDQFVIGSISKQITAVLILQEYEKGRLALHTPIRSYLPEISQSWADTVTVHHLLTHMHGIESLEKPLLFSPGTQFMYSQLGYKLLAQILERVSNSSFVELSEDLFKKAGMSSSFHPERKEYRSLVKGYTEQPDGNITFETATFENYVPAGGFISSVGDLALWNSLLHNADLLQDSTFRLMTEKYATRKHPIFNEIDYGYGLTFKEGESRIRIGALGFTPGFVSSNFYFPETGTSVVILENVAMDFSDIKNTFYHHIRIQDIVQDYVTRKN